MDGQEIHKNQSIKVISRAAEILRVLGRETGGLSLGQIAKRTGLPRSTVQRIVAALAVEGLVSTEQGSGGIRLGPEIQSLAQAAATDLRERLRPIMKRLSDATGETVDLAVLENGRMRFIDQIVGPQRLRTVSSIGEMFPLTTTANGKAALACLDPASAAQRVAEEIGAEPESGRSLVAVLSEIQDVRDGALAVDENEHTDGICALGFAVPAQTGEILALSVPVPSHRYLANKAALEARLLEARRDLTEGGI